MTKDHSASPKKPTPAATIADILRDRTNGNLSDDEIVDISQAIETLVESDSSPSVADEMKLVGDPRAGWFAGKGNVMIFGPYETREAAIHAAREVGLGEFEDDDGEQMIDVHVMYGRNPPLRLSNYVDGASFLETADDVVYQGRVNSDFDEGPYFSATDEQVRDLSKRLARACDEWQLAHNLRFTCRSFDYFTEPERVVAESIPAPAP